ncbi:MAG TPA: hypothetical protein VK076_01290 [Candidatus Sphingobacterium stercoripullorum]|uniref:hypothetical protein n=1 Tax=Sphingobacteriaceae TaxID=84566 RepID=UPI000C0BFEB5|nr:MULTISPECIES: hypothetical protein [Sphingobacteriaceae]MCC2600238.1 hypothetical protein [Sphingobacterium sp. FBM7-1]HLR49189.1 hypothetical protein [Candidatus Sphingobacterium stercoripullorum]
MYNKAPFASWVPKPVMLLLILGILFPVMTVSGVYTSNITDISGALATYTEYISMANNAGAIGMGCAIMILMRIKMRFRTKEIIAGSAIILAILSYMCGTTDSPVVLIVCSLLIGFFKMFPLIEMVLPVMFILSPTGDRGKFYAIFYPLSIGFAQLSAYYFAQMVFDGSWQTPYLFMSAIMLVIAALSLIFQHNQRFGFKMPLYQIDWFSLVVFAASMMSLNYFFVFMKQQNWFHSPNIVGSLMIGVGLFIALIYRQNSLKRKMLDFSVFKKRNVSHSLILLLFLGLYLASSSVYTQYAIGVLGYNNLVNAHTNLWMIPGIVIAGILAFYGFKNKWYLKYYIALGFVFFALHTLCLYLIIQPQMDIRYLEYASILKGLGMGILFIGIWFYASLNLGMNEMMGMIAVLIVVRSFLATALGGAIIGWASYQSQWQSLNDISMYLDAGAIPNGMAIYQNISLNALMASGKIVLGTLTWLVVPILIFIATHSYGSFHYKRVVLLRKKIRGDSIKGYRF